jgi:hypothetical protein|tara:strand:+ start:2979 stop:4496 length:1518 start_codon:yes stop_codon:yes gene_type:complete
MKKYIPLDEVYSAIAYKPVPKVPRRAIRENVAIFADVDGIGDPEKIGTVDDAYFKVLKRQISSKGTDGWTKDVDTILRASKWDQSNKEYKDLLETVIHIIHNKSDTDGEAVSILAQEKVARLGLPGLENAIQENGSQIGEAGIWNLGAVLAPVVGACFTNVEELMHSLYNYSFKINNVGVGKGELLMTMFSNGIKGESGDLDFPSLGEVELKGLDGRPGSQDRAFQARTKLPEFLLDKGKSIHTGQGIQSAHKKVIGAREKLLTPIKKLIDKLHNQDIDQFDNQLEGAIESIGAISDTRNDMHQESLMRFVSKIQNDLYDPKRYDKRTATSIENHLNKYVDALQTYIDAKDNRVLTKKDNPTWNQVVQNGYLNDYGLSRDEYIDSLTLMVNHDLSDNSMNDVKIALNSILQDDAIDKLMFDNDQNTLKKIIATLHLTTYAQHHQFKYLVYMNDKTLNCYTFQFTNNLVEDIPSIFEEIGALGSKLGISLGLDDQMSKGIPLSLKA